MVSTALEVSNVLLGRGISCSVYDFHTIKPIDSETLSRIYQTHSMIVTLEEHSIVGGLGAAVAEHKASFPSAPRQLVIGFDDSYRGTGSRDYVLKLYGLTVEDVVRRIGDALAD